jgi:hypothetical protein
MSRISRDQRTDFQKIVDGLLSIYGIWIITNIIVISSFIFTPGAPWYESKISKMERWSGWGLAMFIGILAVPMGLVGLLMISIVMFFIIRALSRCCCGSYLYDELDFGVEGLGKLNTRRLVTYWGFNSSGM